MPDTMPIIKAKAITNRPVDGRQAKSKKVASPMVVVRTATADPNENLPCTNCVITIIAPPQPSIAPINLAKII